MTELIINNNQNFLNTIEGTGCKSFKMLSASQSHGKFSVRNGAAMKRLESFYDKNMLVQISNYNTKESICADRAKACTYKLQDYLNNHREDSISFSYFSGDLKYECES
ncbi:MAG: hypothetical protein WBJ81_03370 [Rickettsiales bacterium]